MAVVVGILAGLLLNAAFAFICALLTRLTRRMAAHARWKSQAPGHAARISVWANRCELLAWPWKVAPQEQFDAEYTDQEGRS